MAKETKKSGKVIVNSRKIIINGDEITIDPSELASDMYEFLNHIEYEPNVLTAECIAEELNKKGVKLSYPINSVVGYCKENKFVDLKGQKEFQLIIKVLLSLIN